MESKPTQKSSKLVLLAFSGEVRNHPLVNLQPAKLLRGKHLHLKDMLSSCTEAMYHEFAYCHMYTRCELFDSQTRGAHGFPKAGVTFFSNVSPLEHQEEEEFEPLDPKREVFEEPAFAPLGLAQRWRLDRWLLCNETLDFRPLLILIDIEGFGPTEPFMSFWKFDEVWGCHRNSHTFGQSTKSNVKQKNKTNNSNKRSSDFCSNLKLTHEISCHCIV